MTSAICRLTQFRCHDSNRGKVIAKRTNTFAFAPSFSQTHLYQEMTNRKQNVTPQRSSRVPGFRRHVAHEQSVATRPTLTTGATPCTTNPTDTRSPLPQQRLSRRIL